MPTELILTPVERRIATLAATGLTNNEIGRRMFLSGRTIGTYLYTLFPKLGVSSRAGLADALSGAASASASDDFTSPPGDDADVFERARRELAYGRWLRRHRRPRDARGVLLKALRAFERLGAGPWAQAARVELGATAATRRGEPDRLTPQESMVAELAAEGLTNRQIGERMLVSPRTVGSHLGRVFPKLGVGSRAALRGALGRRSSLGLVD
jgi:DNA-binding NarL/FixJ family response regulator